MARHRPPTTINQELLERLLAAEARPRRGGVVVRTARGVRHTSRFGWTHRRGLAPLLWSVLLLAMGAGLSWTPQGGRTAVAVVVMSGPLMWWRGRARKWTRGHARPGGWPYHAAAYVGGSAWLTAASWLGPVPPLPGILLVGMLAVGAPWWWHHRIRPHDDTIDARLFTWETLVAGTGGVLPGAWLTDLEEVYA